MENGVVNIFEAIGDLETVLIRLKEVAPELKHELETLEDVQDGLLDDSLDRGDDLILDQNLESSDDDVSDSPESDVEQDKDSIALEQTATSEDEDQASAGPLSKQAWNKIFRKKKKAKKKYLCATRPKIKSTRRGKRVWYSMIKYKRPDGSLGQLFRVVGRDPNHRPQSITLHGKKIRWC